MGESSGDIPTKQYKTILKNPPNDEEELGDEQPPAGSTANQSKIVKKVSFGQPDVIIEIPGIIGTRPCNRVINNRLPGNSKKKQGRLPSTIALQSTPEYNTADSNQQDNNNNAVSGHSFSSTSAYLPASAVDHDKKASGLVSNDVYKSGNTNYLTASQSYSSDIPKDHNQEKLTFSVAEELNTSFLPLAPPLHQLASLCMRSLFSGSYRTCSSYNSGAAEAIFHEFSKFTQNNCDLEFLISKSLVNFRYNFPNVVIEDYQLFPTDPEENQLNGHYWQKPCVPTSTNERTRVTWSSVVKFGNRATENTKRPNISTTSSATLREENDLYNCNRPVQKPLKMVISEKKL